jgi:hypothetical protein
MSIPSEKGDRKPRELLDLDVREVSLVDRPAIRRKFLVVKRDENGENMSDQEVVASEQEAFVFDEVVHQDAEVEKGYHETKEEEDEKDSSKEQPEEKGMHGRGDKKELEEESEEEEEASKKKKKKKETKKMDNSQSSASVSFSKRDDGSYDLTGVPEEMQATVEAICKQHEAAVQKAAELEEILKAERDERLRRDFVEKAEKEFSNVPGTAVEIGILLKSLNDLDVEVAEKVESIFKAVDAQLSNSAALEEIGSPASDIEVSAWNKIEKQAEELITNGAVSSKAAAISKVLEINPALYSEYLKEGK